MKNLTFTYGLYEIVRHQAQRGCPYLWAVRQIGDRKFCRGPFRTKDEAIAAADLLTGVDDDYTGPRGREAYAEMQESQARTQRELKR